MFSAEADCKILYYFDKLMGRWLASLLCTQSVGFGYALGQIFVRVDLTHICSDSVCLCM